MASKLFEVRSASSYSLFLLKLASVPEFLSSSVRAGISKPLQNEMERPVHKIYKFM